MTHYDYDVGILGGGAAGLTAAAGAAQFGAKTLLVEKAETLGGDCLHYGCVPSKTLIRTARLWAQARRSADFGLPALSLPPVDLRRVMNRVRSVIAKIQEHDSTERFCSLGAEVRFGLPRFVDNHSIDVDGQIISARNWIIATGSRPTLPPVQGLADMPYWTNETVFSQENLPARLLVLGGGPIGLEMAQAFARLGSDVTVVEFMDQILGPEDEDVARIIENRLVHEGVTIMKGTKAVNASVEGGGHIRLTVAAVKNDEEKTILSGDAILVAAGRAPNTEGLGLKAAGVEYTKKGIPTDQRLRTNQKHIFACGDVNGRLPFTHVAGYEGGIALTNAVLRVPRTIDYTKAGWCTYTDPEVASIGYNEKRAVQDGIEYRLFEESFADNDRALAEAAPEGKIKLLVSPKGKILGCQIVGSHAGELIHEWVISYAGGLKLSTLAGAVHVYPTLAEISRKVAGDVFSEKIFSERTRIILRFLFNLKGRACRPETEETD